MHDLLRQQPLFLLGLVAIIGFYMGAFARKGRLPSLIGFMLLGILIGPSVLAGVDHGQLDRFSFITEIALGFVAFAIGSELSLSSLRKLGTGIIYIILFESFAAFLLVALAVYACTGSWPAALLFGALAPASAPAGTVAVIQETRARGTLTKALYAVVGFDDGLAILIFGFAAALARILLMNNLQMAGDGGGFLAAMGRPALEIAGSIGVGAALGFLYCLCIRRLDRNRDLLVMTFGFILTAAGISACFHLSLILTNMVIGFVLVNTRKPATVNRVSRVLHDVMPLLFLLFFTLAGAHLDLARLPSLGVMGLAYILARSAGLIGGSQLGAWLGRSEPKIRKYIGLGILSQAGVAIGLGLIVQHDFAALMSRPGMAQAVARFAGAHPEASPLCYHPGEIAATLILTITATCIVFEIIGPLLTRLALSRAGEIPDKPHS